MLNTNKVNYTDLLLVSLLLIPSGIPYFTNVVPRQVTLLSIFFLSFLLLISKRYLRINNGFLYYVFFFMSLIVVQAVSFPEYNIIEPSIGTFLRIFIAYFIFYMLGQRFVRAYVVMMFYIAIVSIVFLLLIDFGFVNKDIFLNTGFVLQLHEQRISEYLFLPFSRNSGPFWEAGVYGGFLMIAFALNLLVLKERLFSYINIALIIAIITTQSTTTYLSFFVFFVMVSVKKNGFTFKGLLLLVFWVMILFISFNNIPILREKMTDQYLYMYEYIIGETSQYGNQRFLSTYMNLMFFTNSPIYGVGLGTEIRVDLQDYLIEGKAISTNGWVDMLTQWGVIGFMVYFVSMYKSFKKMMFDYNVGEDFSVILILLVFVLGSSSGYFHLPFFWALSIYYLIPRGLYYQLHAVRAER